MSQLPSTLPVTPADILKAAETLKGAVIDTDFDHSRTLSANLGCDVWLKFENLQFTAAYKERGALNKLSSLTEEECERGVIAMSAGNHAQGVAYHAGRLGIPATIVMPEGTPSVKVRNTKRLGAKVILHGQTFDEAAAFTLDYGARKNLTFIHPFDDPLVIAGQGTVALEMLRVAPELDTLIVPIGGGGLISGVAIAAKSIKPSIQIVGVQASLYPSMYNVVKNAKLPVQGDTLAEGIAVKNPGQITRRIVREMVDDIMLVGENLMEEAVCALISIEKTVVEGAGAAGLAAILADPRRFAGRKVGLILCGGNIDSGLLASVLTRDLARQGRLSQLTLDLPDRPGQLARVSGAIGEAGANIVEVYHQRVFTELPARGTELDLVIETRDREHLEATVTTLEAAGYRVVIKGAGT
jgi:threonine dehydratase